MGLKYNGVVVTVSVCDKPGHGNVLAYHRCMENGDTDSKTSFLKAMEKFTETKEFKELTKDLSSNFCLNITHLVDTVMP